jgi:hypothetical protein
MKENKLYGLIIEKIGFNSIQKELTINYSNLTHKNNK